ncbi:hypothetical protein Acor_76760 [Acrocarpospora corrugata]|uniref:DUF732 domain-containing protein n=1 Tax=Acrocarpospora corrugata TaxID=35763 RepID=A0A5M3WGY6_9ACTN|nr:DUF732 domain-containing protein [Acrocarpospora corrugata]GES05608.1 hypothetical protein Acor_76760 [Acrocarpospora corrugata]
MNRLVPIFAVAIFALAGCSGTDPAGTAATGDSGTSNPAVANPSESAVTIAAAPEMSDAQKQEFFTALKDVDAGLAADEAQAISVGTQVCEKILASPDDPMTFSQFAADQLALDLPKAETFVVAVSMWCTPE